MKDFRRKVFRFIEPIEDARPVERAFDWLLISVIIISVLALILGTVSGVAAEWGRTIQVIELIAVTIFSAEYISRIWTADLKTGKPCSIKGRFFFALRPLMLIDLLAIIPFFIHGSGSSLVFLRLFRLVLLFRILKVARYSNAIQQVGFAVPSRLPELAVSVAIMAALIVVGSSLLYVAENESQPEVFSSIPATMWCATSLLTPLGAGAMAPITPMGKLLAGAISLFALGLVALPAGILAAAFSEGIKKDDHSGDGQSSP